MACRTGCPTQDCESYADCCKGVAITPNTGTLTNGTIKVYGYK